MQPVLTPAVEATYRYERLSPGHYLVLRNGEPVAEIERTGAGDGWADSWRWTPLPSIRLTGLQTASSFRALKKLGEAWFERLERCANGHIVRRCGEHHGETYCDDGCHGCSVCVGMYID